MESELELFGNLLGKQIVNKDKVRIENVFDNDSDIILIMKEKKVKGSTKNLNENNKKY